MRTIRVYHQENLHPGQTLILAPEHHHHLLKVLRLKTGHSLEIFNGHTACIGVITATRKHVAVHLTEPVHYQVPKGLSVHLAIACVKAGPFDLILQKVTELGVTHITPLRTEFTQLTTPTTAMHQRQTHWFNIITHACAQSGRYDIPQLHPITHLSEYLQTLTKPTHVQQAYTRQIYTKQPGLKLICHPYPQQQNNGSLPGIPGMDTMLARQNATPPTSLTTTSTITVTALIGPEGGFSAREVAVAIDAGFHPIQLSPHILRTDTAAIALMGLLGYQHLQHTPGR